MPKVLFFGAGQGSGATYRALALAKAFTGKAEFYVLLQTGFSAVLDGLNYTPLTNNYLVDFKRVCDELKPDLVISNYAWGEPEQVEIPRRWLLLRTRTDYENYRKLDLSKWEYIIGIEPTVVQNLAGVIPTANLTEVPPIIHARPNEILGRDAAIEEMSKAWGYTFRPHLPLIIGTANSYTRELELIHKKAFELSNGGLDGQTLVFSQLGWFNARKLPRPIACYMRAIDKLVAPSGYNLFWEWAKYRNEGAEAHWMNAPRKNEDLAYRTGFETDWYRNAPNGADVLTDML